MAKVYPFRALRYSPAKVALDKVVTQPYDKISPDMQERYYQLHPNNLVRIIRGRAHSDDGPANNVYTRAARDLQRWREAGIVEQVDRPGFYAYFQSFRVDASGETKVRKGFIGAGQLEDYAKGVIFPHERTLTGPKQDRLELLRHTRTHFGQVFMLYSEPNHRINDRLTEISSGNPDVHLEDEYGVVHSLWTITDSGIIGEIQLEMEDKQLIIADGHHRYETALAFRNEMRTRSGIVDPESPYERLMMTFVNVDSPGLTILPTHRLLSGLPNFDMDELVRRSREYFEISEAPYQNFAERSLRIESLKVALQREGKTQPAIGVYAHPRQSFFLMHLKSKQPLRSLMPGVSEKQGELDVVVLHKLLLEKCLGISEEAVRGERYVSYVRDADAGIQAVEAGKAQVVFLLNPTPIQQVRDIAFAGEVLPEKSTDFYPKLLSGLTMYSLG